MGLCLCLCLSHIFVSVSVSIASSLNRGAGPSKPVNVGGHPFGVPQGVHLGCQVCSCLEGWRARAHGDSPVAADRSSAARRLCVPLLLAKEGAGQGDKRLPKGPKTSPLQAT